MARRLPIAAGAIMLVSLLVPWFFGTSDGDDLTIAGWDTDPFFTGPMLIAALVMIGAGLAEQPWLVAVAALVCLGLALWMLPRGDMYSGYHLGPGGFIAIAAALAALWVPLAEIWIRVRGRS